jgi:hypothetical protein
MTVSLESRLQEGSRDNMGAAAAREAAEALTAAAQDVRALAREGSPALLAAALIVLRQATTAAERLHNRQLSATLVQEAGFVEGYAAGHADRGLRLVR